MACHQRSWQSIRLFLEAWNVAGQGASGNDADDEEGGVILRGAQGCANAVMHPGFVFDLGTHAALERLIAPQVPA
jgi:hypothetical protein